MNSQGPVPHAARREALGLSLRVSTSGSPESTFHPLPNRDASATIRGFVFQVDHTVLQWLRLPPDAELHLEAGEDVDVLRRLADGSSARELEQVKALAGAVSLRSGSAREFLGNFLLHMDLNPKMELRGRFVTTAHAAVERQAPLPGGLAGIEAWNRARLESEPDREDLLRGLQALLASEEPIRKKRGKNISGHDRARKQLRDFAKQATPGDFTRFVSRIEWSTGSGPWVQRRDEVERVLVDSGLASDESRAQRLYEALFVYVIRKLSHPGPKFLNAKEVGEVLGRPDRVELLSRDFSKIKAGLDALDARVRAIERRQEATEDRLGELEQVVSELSVPHAPRLAEVLLSAVLPGQPPIAVSAIAVAGIGLAPPPALGREAPRPRAAGALAAHVEAHAWVHVTGNSGSGKTRLVSQALASCGAPVWWVRLRDQNVELAADRVRAALLEIEQRRGRAEGNEGRWPDRSVLVLDDLPAIDRSDSLGDLLARLLPDVVRAGGHVVTLGGAPLSARITADFAKGFVHHVRTPAFESDEVLELLAVYEAPAPVRRLNIASFLTATCQGHPELLVAALTYLAEHEWQFDEEVITDLVRGRFAEAVDDGTLRRVSATVRDVAARELLFRLCLATPPITDEDLDAVARVPERIAHAKMHALDLCDLWVQREELGHYSVAPVVRRVGPQQLDAEVRRRVNLALAELILANQPLDPYRGTQAIMHLQAGEDLERAGFLLATSLQAMRAQEAWKRGALTLSLWRELPQGLSPAMALVVRANQAATMAGAEHEAIDAVVLDLKDRLRAVTENEAPFAVLSAITVTFAVVFKQPGLAFDVLALASPWFGHSSQMENDIADELALGVGVLGLGVTSPALALRWSALLRALPPSALLRVAELRAAREACLWATEQLWFRVARGTTSRETWDEVEHALEVLEATGIDLSLEFFAASARRARIVVQAEFRKNLDAAIRLADEARAWGLGETAAALVQECTGRQLSYAGRHAEALARLEGALDGLRLAPEGLATVQAFAYLSAATSAGEVDPRRAVAIAGEAADAARDNTDISSLLRVRVQGTLAVALWRAAGNNAAWPALSEAAEELLGIEERGEHWRDVLAILGHVAGYISSLAATGVPPAVTRDGLPYVAPTPGMFLPRNTKPGEALPPREAGASLCLQLAIMAAALEKFEDEAVWAARGAEIARGAGSTMLEGSSLSHLICQHIVRLAFRDAFTLARRCARVTTAMMRNAEMSPDTLFEDVAVDRILESASADEVATIEGAVAWSAAIPALAVLASRCLAGEDIAPQVHALRAVLRELQAQQRGDTLWGDVLDVLESSFVVRDDVVRLREVANAARRDNNRIVWAAAHLILGVNPGVPPANAVVSELHCFAEADRARILLGSSFPRVLVQLLADNWTRRLKGQAFMLSMPRMLEEDLDASQDVSVRKRLRRILRSAVDAAGVRLSADWEVWLKDQGV